MITAGSRESGNASRSVVSISCDCGRIAGPAAIPMANGTCGGRRCRGEAARPAFPTPRQRPFDLVDHIRTAWRRSTCSRTALRTFAFNPQAFGESVHVGADRRRGADQHDLPNCRAATQFQAQRCGASENGRSPRRTARRWRQGSGACTRSGSACACSLSPCPGWSNQTTRKPADAAARQSPSWLPTPPQPWDSSTAGASAGPLCQTARWPTADTVCRQAVAGAG